jgi:hypothetical protein
VAVAPKGFEKIIICVDQRDIDLGMMRFMASGVPEQKTVS